MKAKTAKRIRAFIALQFWLLALIGAYAVCAWLSKIDLVVRARNQEAEAVVKDVQQIKDEGKPAILTTQQGVFYIEPIEDPKIIKEKSCDF